MDVLQDCVCCEAPDALLKDWFRDNIFHHDSTSEDYAAAFLMLDGEQQHASDTAPLLEALRQPLDVPLQFVTDQQDDVTQDGSFKALSSASSSRHQQAGSSGGGSQKRDTADKTRAKNIKRYKSQAQKDAHKRYRERKRQNINAMEAEVQEKLQLLQQLEAENQQLKCKFRVLQTSYKCSTDIHHIMQLLDGVTLQEQDTSGSSTPLRVGSLTTAATASASALPVSASGTDGSSYYTCGGNSISISDATGFAAAAAAVSSGSSLPIQQQVPSEPAAAEAQATLWQQQQQQQQQRRLQQHDYEAAGGTTLGEVSSWQQQQPVAGVYAAPPGFTTGLPNTGQPLSNQASTGYGLPCQQQQQPQQWQAAQTAGPCITGRADPSAAAPAGAGAAGVGGGQLDMISSVEEGMKVYKDFLRQAQMLMLQQETGSPGVAVAAEEQLCQLTRMVVGRMQPLLVAHGQGLVYDFNTRNLETMAQQEPPPELWPQVLSLMKLTPQQQEDALACYRMFSICLSRLLDKRTALAAQYKELQQRAEALAVKCKEQGEDAGDVQQRADITAASMEALQSIAKNLAAYQSLDGVFAHSITSIISGAQMAVAMVHSYPFLPQWHQLMRHLQLQEAAPAHQLNGQQQQDQRRASRRNVRVNKNPASGTSKVGA